MPHHIFWPSQPTKLVYECWMAFCCVSKISGRHCCLHQVHSGTRHCITLMLGVFLDGFNSIRAHRNTQGWPLTPCHSTLPDTLQRVGTTRLTVSEPPLPVHMLQRASHNTTWTARSRGFGNTRLRRGAQSRRSASSFHEEKAAIFLDTMRSLATAFFLMTMVALFTVLFVAGIGDAMSVFDRHQCLWTVTHSEKSHIRRIKAWPCRQEYRVRTPRKRICCADEACSIGKVCMYRLLRTVCNASSLEMNSKYKNKRRERPHRLLLC